jgi:predicted secreted protein
MPTFRHGKNAVFKVDNSGGTLTDISSALTDVSLPRSIETAETTTFGVTGGAKTYITGLNDATLSVSGRFDATVDAHLAGILGQDATVSFEYGPAGSTAGYVKFTGEAIMTKYDLSSPVGDVVSFSADFQVTGQITRGTY